MAVTVHERSLLEQHHSYTNPQIDPQQYSADMPHYRLLERAKNLVIGFWGIAEEVTHEEG